MPKKPATVYRQLLRDALVITWQNRPLWVFGIFAGIISTGGVVDVAVSGLKRITTADSLSQAWLDRSFIGYAYAGEFILHLKRIGSDQVGALLILMTAIFLFLLFAGTVSQAALVHGTGTHKGKHPRYIRRHALPHFWPLLTVNLLTKAASLTLFLLAALPVLLLPLSQGDHSALVFTHLLLYVPAIILLNILSMLAVMDVVEADAGASHAVWHSFSLFRRHWLSAIELGLLLFLIVIGAVLLFAAGLGVLSLPYGLAYTAAVANGSTFLFFLTNLLAGLVAFALLFAFGGAAVTFQYSAWRLFYVRATHHLHGKKPFAKIWRLLFA